MYKPYHDIMDIEACSLRPLLFLLNPIKDLGRVQDWLKSYCNCLYRIIKENCNPELAGILDEFPTLNTVLNKEYHVHTHFGFPCAVWCCLAILVGDITSSYHTQMKLNMFIAKIAL